MEIQKPIGSIVKRIEFYQKLFMGRDCNKDLIRRAVQANKRRLLNTILRPNKK